MLTRALVAALAGAALPVGAGLTAAAAATAMAPCDAARLSATFTHIFGSNGAGNVAYQLTVVNRTRGGCSLGRPTIHLLGRHGAGLPSHSTASGARIVLAAGRRAGAAVRFTPDVPAATEHQRFPCEPLAYSVSVAFAGSPGRAIGPVTPATPVCQHGGMEIRALRPA
jgi:hypothetical protein